MCVIMENNSKVKVNGISSMSQHKWQFLAAIVASIGSFGLGNVFGWTAPALPDLNKKKDFGNLTSAESSWIASLAILGAFLSGPISGFLINRIGRKILMLFMALPFTIGWVLMAGANNLAMMYVGRFMTGFAGGSFTVTIPIYVSEIAEDNIRGTLGSIMVLTLVCGMLFTFSIGTIVSWSKLSLICTTIPILFFSLMLFMPESPRFLLMKGKIHEARNSVLWLRGKSILKQVDHEMIKIKSTFVVHHHENSNITPCVKQLLVSLCLFIFQQFSGINGITLYTVDIFKSAGSPLTPNMASIIIGIVQVLFVLLSLIIVDKVGRKSLLVMSNIIMGLGLLVLGTFYYFKENNYADDLNSINWIPLVCLATFIMAYSVGAGPLPWLLMSELLPVQAQGIGSSFITSCYWIMAFISALTFKDHFYHYWFFSGTCFIGAIFTYFIVPETKGKTSEEIQRYFGSKIDNTITDEDENNILTTNNSLCGSRVDFDNNIKAEKV